MDRCKCGSFAINEHAHGRIKGKHSDLCDVCYWREEAKQAHREGWEQGKREAKSTILDHFTCCDFTHGCDHDWCNMLKEIADAIASMGYKEKAND